MKPGNRRRPGRGRSAAAGGCRSSVGTGGLVPGRRRVVGGEPGATRTQPAVSFSRPFHAPRGHRAAPAAAAVGGGASVCLSVCLRDARCPARGAGCEGHTSHLAQWHAAAAHARVSHPGQARVQGTPPSAHPRAGGTAPPAPPPTSWRPPGVRVHVGRARLSRRSRWPARACRSGLRGSPPGPRAVRLGLEAACDFGASTAGEGERAPRRHRPGGAIAPSLALATLPQPEGGRSWAKLREDQTPSGRSAGRGLRPPQPRHDARL